MGGLTGPWPRAPILALMVVGCLLVTAVPALAQEDGTPAPGSSPEPRRVAELAEHYVNDWPGTRAAPAGLYSYRTGDGPRWMHKVPAGFTQEAPNSVELTFVWGTGDDRPDFRPADVGPAGDAWWTEGPFVEPTSVARVVTQVWLLDVGDQRVAIRLESYPDTDPDLVAEAVAVVESITVRPADDGAGSDLVFRLERGWDSG